MQFCPVLWLSDEEKLLIFVSFSSFSFSQPTEKTASKRKRKGNVRFLLSIFFLSKMN
jgi:hypothetical protein